MNIKIATSTITFAFLLSGCGGGGGGTAAPVAVPKVAAMPTLSYTPVKGFKFNWTDVSDATSYKILENKNGASGFSKIGNDIAQGVGTTTQTVPLHKRVNAQYILQSCTAGGCIDSAAISVTGTLVDSIGYVKASNTAKDDYFGASISLSSDESTLAVGAPGVDNSAIVTDSGAVYIFTRTGSTWTEEDFLKAGTPGKEAEFGISVSLSSDGNTLAVGESGRDGSILSQLGAAYIFTRTNSKWTEKATLTATNRRSNDEFGGSVSLSSDGSALAVGAINALASDVNNNLVTGQSGAAYIFALNNSNWALEKKITANYPGNLDQFGHSVSLNIDGTTLAIGAPYEMGDTPGVGGNSTAQQQNSSPQAGAAYIFKRTGTNWAQQTYVKASKTGPALFGWSVSLSSDGKTLAAGAKGEDSNARGVGGDQNDNNATNSGAVYIFSQSVTAAWSQLAYVKASNTGTGDEFGYSVSLSSDGLSVSLSSDGSTLAVAAPFEDSNATGIDGKVSDDSASDSGAVYLY